MIACLADTFSNVELATEWANLTADSILIEVITFRAFEALIFVPGLAAIVVGYGDELGEWYFATWFIEAAEIAVEGGEGEIAMGETHEEQ